MTQAHPEPRPRRPVDFPRRSDRSLLGARREELESAAYALRSAPPAAERKLRMLTVMRALISLRRSGHVRYAPHWHEERLSAEDAFIDEAGLRTVLGCSPAVNERVSILGEDLHGTVVYRAVGIEPADSRSPVDVRRSVRSSWGGFVERP
ncbi:hypothetical protein [Streptomyces microflavus]|uniref:hypothetical protein n=1 Tax=Streptomyces microflavus TaxID=1919 RepID=UPI0033FC6498